MLTGCFPCDNDARFEELPPRVRFAEAEGFSHVHFHVVPRLPDLAPERRGPGVFGLLGVPPDRCVPEARMDEMAAALAGHLITP